MSNQGTVEAFLERLKTDEGLRLQLSAVDADVMQIARAAGYDFTEEALVHAASGLSEAELDEVTGGFCLSVM